MNKKIIALMLGLTLLCVALAGCGKQSTLDKIEKNNKVVWEPTPTSCPLRYARARMS